MATGDRARAAARFQEGLAHIALTLQRAAGLEQAIAAVCTHAHQWFNADRTLINWSSSFKWFNDPSPISFAELGELGYKFLFITLAAQHAFGYGFAKLLQGLSEEQQHAYIALQRKEWQVGDDIPTRSHHLFTGVPYHQTMGSVMGASRLGTQFDEKLGEKAV